VENIPLKIGKKGLNVNYFANLEAECHFSKLGCRESSFPKRRGQCNLPLLFKVN
jgi:hypothetical protein